MSHIEPDEDISQVNSFRTFVHYASGNPKSWLRAMIIFGTVAFFYTIYVIQATVAFLR